MPAGTIIATAEDVTTWTQIAAAETSIENDASVMYVKDGWAWCNGAIITKAAYADLASKVATAWNTEANPLTGNSRSVGNITNNFRIPDFRGSFLRGVGNVSRVSQNNQLGVFQKDQFQTHEHYTITGDATDGGGQYFLRNGSGSLISSVNEGVATPNTGLYGTETRPQNVGVYYLVKLYDNAAPVDVFIPSAAAGIMGLVNNTSANTAGTPIKGRTNGVAVAAGDVGYITRGTATFSSSNSSGTWQGSSLSLTNGVYNVSIRGYTPRGSQTIRYIACGVGLSSGSSPLEPIVVGNVSTSDATDGSFLTGSTTVPIEVTTGSIKLYFLKLGTSLDTVNCNIEYVITRIV
jgi:hypothetical protein